MTKNLVQRHGHPTRSQAHFSVGKATEPDGELARLLGGDEGMAHSSVQSAWHMSRCDCDRIVELLLLAKTNRVVRVVVEAGDGFGHKARWVGGSSGPIKRAQEGRIWRTQPGVLR